MKSGILLCREILIFSYALFTWKKKAHAIIVETIGLHWWLHEKSPTLSIILLLLNIYTVFFFLAEIQITRLHLIVKNDGKLYITQGITARTIVPISLIKEVG